MKNGPVSLALLPALFAVVALPALAGATDIQVRAGGSIHDALASAQPGDRVLVHAGTYTGGDWIGPVHGTAAAPITVLSADGPRTAIIQGGGETLRIGDASSYLVFDGFEIRNSGDNAIHIDGHSNHITLRNLYGHDAGPNGDVLKVNQCDHITVENCEFARPGAYVPNEGNPYQQCLDFVDVADSVVTDNYLHDGGSQLFFVKGGSTRVTIARNTFSNEHTGASDPMVGLGGATDLDLLGSNQYEASAITFVNNILVGGVMGGVGVYDVDGVYIANNLFVNNDRVLIEFRAGNGPAAQSTDIRVENNVFTDSRGHMPVPYLQSSHGVHALTTSNNLYWNHGGSIPATTLLAMASQPGYMTVDPMIAAPAATSDRATIIATTRPASGSPATGTGIDTSAAPFSVMDDITGVARAMPYDRGPFVIGHPVAPPVTVDAGAPTPPVVVADAGTPVPPVVAQDAGSAPPVVAQDAGSTPPVIAQDAGPTVADAATTPVVASDAGTTARDGGREVASRDGGTSTVASRHDAATPGDGEPAGIEGSVGCSAKGGAGSRDGLIVLAVAAVATISARRRKRIAG